MSTCVLRSWANVQWASVYVCVERVGKRPVVKCPVGNCPTPVFTDFGDAQSAQTRGLERTRWIVLGNTFSHVCATFVACCKLNIMHASGEMYTYRRRS